MKTMALLAVTVTMVVLTSCKKEEPTPTFNGDFKNLTTELLESTIGVDSSLVVDKLLKDGFLWDEQNSQYVNNSLGLSYDIRQYKDNKVFALYGGIEYKSAKEIKDFLIKENKNQLGQMNPMFKGMANDKVIAPTISVCEKNQQTYEQIFETTDYGRYDIYYANGNFLIQYYFRNTSEPFPMLSASIYVSQLDKSNPVYTEASSDCIK